jgi:hypothetical protein
MLMLVSFGEGRSRPGQERRPPGGTELGYVEADNGLAAEHPDDHSDKAQTVGTMDNGAVESGEWPIDHPHLLSNSRMGRCASILVPLVVLQQSPGRTPAWHHPTTGTRQSHSTTTWRDAVLACTLTNSK